MFKDKHLLITGGTGSFGNTVLKRFLDTDIKKITVFSRDEKKQEDMRLSFSNSKLKFIIGDVRDLTSVQNALKDVDYVFHAAALKQVPICEFFPSEAFKTNVLGTENVVDACINADVKRVVVLSTDKAVYPINAMGISKAMAEKIVIAKSRNAINTTLCLTRYGNVMASRASVIPHFVESILNNKELTITDGNMTRFLMSLENSVDLVLHAFKNGENGDLFVQKSPACTVFTLAEALSQLFNREYKYKIIGKRHGEKLYETLVSNEEMAKSIDQKSFYKIPSDNRDLNYEKYITQGEPDSNEIEDYSSHNTDRLDVDETKKLLLTVPYVVEKLKHN